MKAQLIDAAWTQLAPAVELGGVARDTGYETAIQDAMDAETAIAEAVAAIENKRVERDEKVAALAAKTALVIAGVIGNPAYGPDSDLYGAMGYIRKSQRQSGLTQKFNVQTPPPAPPAHSLSGLPRAAKNARHCKVPRVFSFAAFLDFERLLSCRQICSTMPISEPRIS